MRTTGGFAGLVCGRWTKWVVLVLWLVVLGVAFPLAGKLTGAEKNDNSAWLPASAESTKVLDQVKAFQPDETAPTVVVYDRAPAAVTAADLEAATNATSTFKQFDVSGDVIGPIPSQDGQAIQIIVPVKIGNAGWDSIADTVAKIREDAVKGAPPGLNVHVTGPGGIAADQSEAFAGIDGTLLYATLIVVIVILLFTYRSPVLWLLPVITAGAALFAAEAVIYLLAKHAGLTVNAQSAAILTVLVFGAGTDYALLLVARYREELRRHEDRHEAMAFALHRAGPAIIASASTVAIGMLCLLVAEMNSTKGLGPVAAIGIAVGLLAMITLLPALLVAFGRWIFWPTRPAFGTVDPTAHGVWSRVGNLIAKRARITWIVTALVLGAFAFGITELKATGLSVADSFINKPDSVVGAEIQARHFPAGAGQPVVVIADAAKADEVRTVLGATAGIAETAQPRVQGGTAYVEGTLRDSPDSRAAERTIDRVREAVHAVPGANAIVGGQTAIVLDAKRASERDNRWIIPLVLLVVLLILAVLLRSIVAPLLLITTVVLSFATALGVSALVFRHLLGFKGADPSLPLYVFVFLVALGIDYNIFLMTRVREESSQHGTRRGALVGLAATGGVITSAGLVLAGTFAVLGTLPVVAFAEIGFAVAFGVILDTIVVRSILVTALSLDIGRFIWWPSRLAKVRDETTPAAETADETPALVT